MILLGIAMPLKRLAGLPLAVTVVGWIHGILFVLYCIALARAAVSAQWPASRTLGLFVASLLPFGTFVTDARLKREERAARDGTARVPTAAT